MRQYAALLRNNPNYARLWLAQAISLLGDWFNTIVLAALVSKYSDGSGIAISLLLLARFLPPLLVSPLAGVLLDRFDRKRLLIVSDVVRALIVLCFLFVRSSETLWIVYVLTVLQFSFSSIFEPGRSALMPSVVRREDLVQANILGSITWSVMLALGGALGGVVSAALGTEFALIFDAVTFMVSALLIASIRVTHPTQDQPLPPEHRAKGINARDFIDGLRWAVKHPTTSLVLLVKAGGAVGNMDSILIIYATYLFVWGEEGFGSLGLLWCAFGIGAVIGPILVNRFNNGTVRTMRRLIIVGYGLITLGWIVMGGAPILLIAAAGTIIKAMGSSIYWTYSSVILQKSVPDQFLGRLFSLDMSGFQLSAVLSIVVTGIFLEMLGKENIRAIVFGTAVVSLVPLILWSLAVPWIERREARMLPVEPPAPAPAESTVQL